MNEYFNYKSKYGEYENCYFQVGKYENGNTAVSIWSAEEGPITKVTVNPTLPVSPNRIAIKDYSENEGMVDWLKSMGLIDTCYQVIYMGNVQIPVYNLTDKGKEEFGIK